MADEQKTERGTPRRRQKARERGQLTRTRDLPSALTLLGVAAMLRWGLSGWVPVWRGLFANLLSISSHVEINNPSPLFNLTMFGVVRWAAPPLALAWCISAMGLLAQGGFVFAPQAFEPKWDRFNPANNISRIFSVGGLSPLLKSLLPASLLIYFGVAILTKNWSQLIHSSQMGLPAATAWLAGLLYEFAWKGGLVLLVWSGIDYGLQRWNYERSLRMTKQEVRDESKDTEGNPATRGRIRRRIREMRRKYMLQQVRRATVVITNPDEFAVALEYIPEEMAAPVVVAKGRGELAQKIKREARWQEIPIVENRPLAQALYRTVEVGGTIPAKLYRAVAEVLAFIYRAQASVRAQAAANQAKGAGAAPPNGGASSPRV
jgi:flagellar biosynthetic protein FlhB